MRALAPKPAAMRRSESMIPGIMFAGYENCLRELFPSDSPSAASEELAACDRIPEELEANTEVLARTWLTAKRSCEETISR